MKYTFTGYPYYRKCKDKDWLRSYCNHWNPMPLNKERTAYGAKFA